LAELREFARRSTDLNRLGVLLVPVSVDDQQHAHEVWEKVANEKFASLSDPGAAVIRKYGLPHHGGGAAHGGTDIALRTTLLIDPEGREQWRRVSKSVPDIPKADETFADIRKAQNHERRMDKDH
jgi:peroxiredoxin